MVTTEKISPVDFYLVQARDSFREFNRAREKLEQVVEAESMFLEPLNVAWWQTYEEDKQPASTEFFDHLVKLLQSRRSELREMAEDDSTKCSNWDVYNFEMETCQQSLNRSIYYIKDARKAFQETDWGQDDDGSDDSEDSTE